MTTISKNLKTVLITLVSLIIVVFLIYSCSSTSTYPESPDTTEPTTEPITQSDDLETYSSEQFSFQYPKGYTVTPPTDSFPVLTIQKADNQRLEIFQIKDFTDRSPIFLGTETQVEIDAKLPKDTYNVGTMDNEYDVWLYYSEDDAQTKAELTLISDSIELN